MLSSVPVSLAVAALLGFLSGLGIGGGSLLMLWLTLVLGLPQNAARTMNLAFFLPAAAIAAWMRWKQGQLPWKQVWPAVAAGCAAALVSTWVSGWLDSGLLKKLFGGLLVLTGLREVFYRPKA